MKRLSIAGSLAVFLVTSAPTAFADEVTATAILGASPFAHNTYGVNVVKGRAKLTSDDENTRTRIVVKISGLTPGTTHIGHIHGGNCPSLFVGAILHNLEPIVIDRAGEGVSKTEIPEGMQGLRDCDWWVAIHEGPANTSPQTPSVAVGPVITKGKEQKSD